MRLPGSILIDLEGTVLTQEDQELLRHPVCAGIVLFARNYENPRQLRALTEHIRAIYPQALVAVDQEGGQVQRFQYGFTRLPPMAQWGALYDQDPQACYQKLPQVLHILATELRAVGINLNLVPVLDINHQASEIIGKRSLHQNPAIVAELGELIIRELHRHHFPAVGKHFPGHGGVHADSHITLPVDTREWATLWQQDLYPFMALAQQLDAIMPAHILFPALDHRPASFSPFWLQEVLRRQLNFQGVIISDDLTMAAAVSRGSYEERAVEAFLAGCDLLLVCNNRTGAVAALEALLAYDRRRSAQRLTALYAKM